MSGMFETGGPFRLLTCAGLSNHTICRSKYRQHILCNLRGTATRHLTVTEKKCYICSSSSHWQQREQGECAVKPSLSILGPAILVPGRITRATIFHSEYEKRALGRSRQTEPHYYLMGVA
jgi:hypothetical protein